MPKTAIVRFTGVNPLIMSRFHGTQKLNKEADDDYELRTWKLKAHYSIDGETWCHPDEPGSKVAIPTDAFKQSLDSIATRLSEKTKGKATYTKHFKSGVVTPMFYSLTTIDPDVFKSPVPIFCSSTGKKGTGSRVMRYFPRLMEWQVDVTFQIWDDVVTKEIFDRYCKEAGMLIGIGSFRRENGGRCGTFTRQLLEWSEGIK